MTTPAATHGLPPAEHPVDAALARALLAQQHPDLAELPIRPAASGWDNVMFRLGEALALRLPRRAAGAELVGDPVGLEERIVQEAAAMATKADVREELDRLAGHVTAARALIESDGASGRRLDFLIQEFMREANTLCSKSGLAELTTVGLELKATIEQFREQVQNVE